MGLWSRGGSGLEEGLWSGGREWPGGRGCGLEEGVVWRKGCGLGRLWSRGRGVVWRKGCGLGRLWSRGGSGLEEGLWSREAVV